MGIKELAERSNAIRSRYHELEVKHHQSKWSIEEDLLALSNDIGNLNRLTMTKLDRYYDETPYTLEQKLAENIWWLMELSNRLEVDIEAELAKFLTNKEEQLGL
ncbi:MazG-like protein [Enterococcus hailinensis]|uniref:MazG-like protein n=1 Tax=Enterococcus hailinensis TaxID=3238988 RepID=UPI0038B3C1AC